MGDQGAGGAGTANTATEVSGPAQNAASQRPCRWPGAVPERSKAPPANHPIAATGARMVITMIHELRRRGATLGVVSMCAGGGMGSAMVVEIPA